MPGSGLRLTDIAGRGSCEALISATSTLTSGKSRAVDSESTQRAAALWRTRAVFDRSPTIGKVLRDYAASPTFALLATFPGSLSDAVDPCILTPERARNRAMSRRISWNKGVSEPEGRLAQVHPEDE